MQQEFSEALGLDVGEKNIGVARVSAVARLPEPVETIQNDDSVFQVIADLCAEFESDTVVVGLPRNMNSEDTPQTKFSRDFAAKLEANGMRVELQDEAMTSKQAQELIRSGVYKRNLRGSQVTDDEVAACLILQDFIGEARV